MKRILSVMMLAAVAASAGAQTNPAPTNPPPAAATNNVAVPKTYSETPDYAALSRRLNEIEKSGQARRVDVVKVPKDALYTKSVNYSGLLIHAIKTPKSGNLLQLFNPFAPPEYDTRRPVNEFNPLMLTARPRPHAFTDDRTHEPNGMIFISAGF